MKKYTFLFVGALAVGLMLFSVLYFVFGKEGFASGLVAITVVSGLVVTEYLGNFIYKLYGKQDYRFRKKRKFHSSAGSDMHNH